MIKVQIGSVIISCMFVRNN